MKYTILAKEWRSARHTVGFIAYATNNPANEGEWNSVVGYRYNYGDDMWDTSATSSEENDAQYIAANGAKLEAEIAHLLFPKLDITKHKYYSMPSDTATDVPS